MTIPESPWPPLCGVQDKYIVTKSHLTDVVTILNMQDVDEKPSAGRVSFEDDLKKDPEQYVEQLSPQPSDDPEGG